MSKWLITQMNRGKYNGKQVIPEDVIKATLTPAIANDNSTNLEKGYLELLSPTYGMARNIASYRGHLITYHGGDINGIHSQVSFMPTDSIGVIVFTIGDHTYPLYNTITFNIYEKLLGLDETPWSDRRLKDRISGKQAGKEGRSKAGLDKVENTKPSHPIEDYAGVFEHPAYGDLTVSLKEKQLQFDFHKIILPLNHYHFDRFDTPDDENDGKWSVNYLTNPQGEIDKLVMPVDEGEVIFTRKPDAKMTDPIFLAKYQGNYELAGETLKLSLNEDNILVVVIPGQPVFELVPIKMDKFKIKQFSDIIIQFINEKDIIIGFDISQPSGVFRYTKK